jgi:uncharacterized phage protein (TIGR01671 family)
MREILFRGKRFSNGEWVIGGIMKTFHPNYYCDNEKDFFSQKPNCYCICANNKDYCVEQSSVGQYTGLTDKNGIKIFEGDIVAGAVHWLERMKNGVVVFRDGSFGLLWHRGEVEQFAPFTSLCNVEYEVIGNIHDTPELLKGGESDG